MAPRPRDRTWTRHLRNTMALRIVRLLILLFTIATLPILFVYHDQMNKLYGVSAAATPMSPSNSSTSTSSPSTLTTTLWSSMHTVDYVYIVLTLITLFLHGHPNRPFFHGFQVMNLCVLIVLAYIWIMLSFVWFTDLIWLKYDPLLFSAGSNLSPTPTTSIPAPSITPSQQTKTTAGVIAGYTLFPSTEPLIQSFFAPTATVPIAAAQQTAAPTLATNIAQVQTDANWAGQCHTAAGLSTGPCELMLIYHLFGCILSAALLIEGTLSWWIYMQEDSAEVKMQKLKAIDEQKMVKEAKKNKRVQRDMQACAPARIPVIQGPMIG
ncbi:hypothetical protein EDD21DRAFT_373971 [Dissophora ornata]|nr:hypothetical protein BGZ58_007247 [Dissophora ornata]KAI8601621.1 hypothetical protein EDD21DRAFT_373971 [Dissophora ornata]